MVCFIYFSLYKSELTGRRHAFIYLLNELRMKATGDEADRAWELCEESFQYHPELIRGEYALYRAIRAIALRAWSARESEMRKQGIYVAVPNFIMQARERAGIKPSNGPHRPATGNYPQPIAQNMMSNQPYPPYGPATTAQPMLNEPLGQSNPQLGYSASWPTMPGEDLFMAKSGHSPIDWDAWDHLVQMDLPTLEFGLEAFFK